MLKSQGRAKPRRTWTATPWQRRTAGEGYAAPSARSTKPAGNGSVDSIHLETEGVARPARALPPPFPQKSRSVQTLDLVQEIECPGFTAWRAREITALGRRAGTGPEFQSGGKQDRDHARLDPGPFGADCRLRQAGAPGHDAARRREGIDFSNGMFSAPPGRARSLWGSSRGCFGLAECTLSSGRLAT